MRKGQKPERERYEPHGMGGLKESTPTALSALWFTNFSFLSVSFSIVAGKGNEDGGSERDIVTKGEHVLWRKSTCQRDGEVAMTTTYTAGCQSCFIGVWRGRDE